MRQLRFVQVDVFAERPFGGNQLAVFLDAAGLTAEQRQAIAAEMNYSESTFVEPATAQGYSFSCPLSPTYPHRSVVYSLRGPH